MDTADRLKVIFKNIKPNIDPDSITLQADLRQDLNVDSLSMILLALAIEKEFDFRFDTVNSFRTVGDVVSYIDSVKK